MARQWSKKLSIVGPQGPKGDQGIRGPQGIQGPKGEQGERGDCNFATFEVENGKLIANTTANSSEISFSLNGADLEVTING